MMAFALAEHKARSPNSWNEHPSSSGVEISSLCLALSIFDSQAEIKIRTLLGVSQLWDLWIFTAALAL